MDDIAAQNIGRKMLPKYKKVRSYILEQIKREGWPADKPLPSELALAKELGVARNTVRQALDELAAENIVRKIHGKGTFFNLSSQQEGNDLGAFGMIVPELHRSMYPCLLKGFDDGASQRYHKTIIGHTDFNLGRQADIILQMLSSKISGVAIVPNISAETPIHHIVPLQRDSIPVVFCVRGVHGVDAPIITWDSYQAGVLAAREFIRCGHKDIGYFACYAYETTRSQEAGLRKALDRNGLILSDEHVYFGTKLGDQQEKDKQSALKRMFDSSNRPTAIFCNDDTEAEIVYLISQKLGIKVPEELSILGAGVCRREGYMKQCLSSITIDAFEMGRQTAILLEEMSSGIRPIAQSCKILMPLTLWAGQTLADAP